jgi:D-alanyl-D-alanine carboxypeptidase (penicillin-binding protein 5/6)
MTALVFLDNNPGWDNLYEIGPTDKISGGRLNLFTGDQVRLKDLFYTSLVASDNGATIALVHASGLSEGEFVKRMNAKARELNLSQTKFEDAVGLSDNNVSTAREIAILAQAALAQPEIRSATASSHYQFTTVGGKVKDIESTDDLLSGGADNSLQVQGGKTGYTEKAGYCFVGLLQDKSGRQFISVILNSQSRGERFAESEKLVNWIISNYQWSKK